MFKKISKIYQGLKSLSSADIVSSINSSLNSSSFSNFNRDNTQSILQKLGGYQYFSADIIAKQIASQKLRLYAKNGERRSKYSNSTEKIIVKNVPVSKYKLDYFRGENKELCHDSLRYKTLTAENGIVEILDHPALDLINSINSYSNKWEFLYTLALSMQFYGNSYFLKVRNTDNSVAEMWLAPTQYMKIIQGKTLNNFIDHYEYGNNFGSPQIYDPNDICDFKMP